LRFYLYASGSYVYNAPNDYSPPRLTLLMDISALKTLIPSSPAFVLDEAYILDSLNKLSTLRTQSGCKVLYSIKSLPFVPVLEMAKPFVDGFSVSSLFEAKLAAEVLAGNGSVHLTTPGIRPDEIDDLAAVCSHISFNSLNQHQHFAAQLAGRASVGLRVNPKLSFVKDERYNPCRQYSKLGVDIDALWQTSVMDSLAGLHVHTLFGASDYAPMIKTLDKLIMYMGNKLAALDWLNLGGGYLYPQIINQQPFIDLVQRLTSQYNLSVYIEPGNAVVGGAGYLLATVIDTFVNEGKSIAVLDTSVNHLPEVFEYQLSPQLHEHEPNGSFPTLLAGSTCLAGDIFGEYRLAKPLQLGDKVVFKQVGAYSLVKASRFNGYNLPSIYRYNADGVTKLKSYTYEDYRQQWSAD